MNLYQVLELKPNASEKDIKNAYKKLALIYHPDKNKDPDAIQKFQQIQSAYEILMDDKIRMNYLQMNDDQKTQFQVFLEKLFKNTLKFDELNILKNLIQKKDWEYLQSNYGSLFNSLNLKELFHFFTQGTFPKKNINTSSNCSDSDINLWDETQAEYYYDLPIYYQKNNKLDIKINLSLTLSDLIEQNKRKIKIKRNMEDEQLTTTFIFNLNKPLIVFNQGGDMDDGDWGNLIIQLNLPKNFIWKENLIYYEYPLTLYQMVYGLDVNLNMGINNISYNNWVPSRDGLIINIDKVKIKNHYFAIKFILDYEDSEDKEEILKTYFN